MKNSFTTKEQYEVMDAFAQAMGAMFQKGIRIRVKNAGEGGFKLEYFDVVTRKKIGETLYMEEDDIMDDITVEHEFLSVDTHHMAE